jgi:hypothetical protein
MNEKAKKLFTNPWFWTGIVLLIILLITIQNLLLPPKTFFAGGPERTHYNNYQIFKYSFFHLIENKDLYAAYPEHWDYYKYSPTFAALMAPFAALPDAAGLLCWNLLNGLVLFFAMWKLPFQVRTRLLVFALVFLELFASLHNSQSNALIAGLILFAFISLEKKRIALAALFIVITAFIKVFGIVALVLFLFYPNKLKAFFWTIGWIVLLAALPLLFVSTAQLTFLYESWMVMIRDDHSMSVGLSVAGWLYTWFGIEAKNPIVIFGAILFCLPLLRYKYYAEIKFRLLFLASILLWIVIFNHKAEAPTFVIAVTGVGIWYFSQKAKIENTILLFLVVIFTVLSDTGIFPKAFYEEYILRHVFKAVPCILVWFKLFFELMLYKPGKELQYNLAEQ